MLTMLLQNQPVPPCVGAAQNLDRDKIEMAPKKKVAAKRQASEIEPAAQRRYGCAAPEPVEVQSQLNRFAKPGARSLDVSTQRRPRPSPPSPTSHSRSSFAVKTKFLAHPQNRRLIHIFLLPRRYLIRQEHRSPIAGGGDDRCVGCSSRSVEFPGGS
jgi:hypothetical protein